MFYICKLAVDNIIYTHREKNKIHKITNISANNGTIGYKWFFVIFF